MENVCRKGDERGVGGVRWRKGYMEAEDGGGIRA